MPPSFVISLIWRPLMKATWPVCLLVHPFGCALFWLRMACLASAMVNLVPGMTVPPTMELLAPPTFLGRSLR